MSQTFYVSQNGNDSNNGTKSSPIKSLKQAYKRINHKSSDTILLKRGDVFNEENIVWEKSGSSAKNMLTVDAWGDDTDDNPEIAFETSVSRTFHGIHSPTGPKLVNKYLNFRNLKFTFPNHTPEKVKKFYIYANEPDKTKRDKLGVDWFNHNTSRPHHNAIRLHAEHLHIENCEALNCGFMISGVPNKWKNGEWLFAKNIVFSKNTVKQTFGSYGSFGLSGFSTNVAALTIFYGDTISIIDNSFKDNGFQMNYEGDRFDVPHYTNGSIHLYQCKNVQNVNSNFD